MRALVQRVSSASVSVDGELVSEIGAGLLVLLGVSRDDTEEAADWLAAELATLVLPSRATRRERGGAQRGSSTLTASTRRR